MISQDIIDYIDKHKILDPNEKFISIEVNPDNPIFDKLTQIFKKIFQFIGRPEEVEINKDKYRFNLGDMKNIILFKHIMKQGNNVFIFSYKEEDNNIKPDRSYEKININ